MIARKTILYAAALIVLRLGAAWAAEPTEQDYTGSSSCRPCHEKFYQLWSTSHHALAMQPYTEKLARSGLTSQTEEIAVGPYRYRADLDAGLMHSNGPDGAKTYPIQFALGGKNVYYFLTPMYKGRLQTLPVAYDVNRKQWFDTAGSGVRHFPDQPDAAVDWREYPYTFNTSCYNCHVSQLTNNYNVQDDSYETTWGEPGINCETCHGPATEHIRVCREAPEGEVPKDLKLPVIMQKNGYSAHQVNTACAPCHAKMRPITADFKPGDRYFDHFGLATLEDRDFYPDGRDLGENYTFTSWRMSPCVKSGQLDCMHCHTSSGRYRHVDDPNQSCLPCHAERVENVGKHSHHKPGKKGARCIDCHMPTTEFARMHRSDHSMRPPTPAATIAFKSPNACNLCHTKKDAVWTNKQVRKWHADDYQKPVLELARLIQDARKEEWTNLDAMLAYITSSDRDEVFATSLIHLVRANTSPKIRATLLKALDDPSPLARSAAVDALGGRLDLEMIPALVKAAGDDYRLVRILAASALAPIPPDMLKNDAERKVVEKAMAEYLATVLARPDNSLSHYNLANFHAKRQEHELAIVSFEKSAALDPASIPPLVNVSLSYNALGRNADAEAALRKALALDAGNSEANINLGMLMAEMGRPNDAIEAFRAALKTNPKSAQAAYNLSILLIEKRPDEAMEYLRKASDLSPDLPRYAYSLAFYLDRAGKGDAAADILEALTAKHPDYLNAYSLLADMRERWNQLDKAEGVYRRALESGAFSGREEEFLIAKLRALEARKTR